MGETSIEWCRPVRADGSSRPGFTFSPWWGCEKVSEACKYCYADTFATRVGHGKRLPVIWGGGATERRLLSEDHWKKPILWNQRAEAAGERCLVFSGSMCDVFEDRPDLIAPRGRLTHDIIPRTPHLIWLLLSKRPENMVRLAPASWRDGWPANVFAGTTVENKARAEERVPRLLGVPAVAHFLSCEPLLEAINLRDLPCNVGRLDGQHSGDDYFDALTGDGLGDTQYPPDDEDRGIYPRIRWVLAGGESGPNARPMHPAWARSLREQCAAAGVPFLFKQWGEWAPHDGTLDTQREERAITVDGRVSGAAGGRGAQRRGTDISDGAADAQWFVRAGKAGAGRLLDGVVHHAFPGAIDG